VACIRLSSLIEGMYSRGLGHESGGLGHKGGGVSTKAGGLGHKHRTPARRRLFRCPFDETRVSATRNLYRRRESDLNAERVGSCRPVLIEGGDVGS
jgi:hypothetical protein